MTVEYRSKVKTIPEIKPEAYRLLQQVVNPTGKQTFRSISYNGEDYTRLVYIPRKKMELTINQEKLKAPEPAVYVSKSGEGYSLFLVYDKERLPFYCRTLDDYRLLPLLNPDMKPEKELPVEALLTLEGVEEVEAALSFSGQCGSEGRETLERLKNTPQEWKLAAFFDNCGGDYTDEELYKEVKRGRFIEGGTDAQAALQLLTGKDTSTEESYLEAVTYFLGKKPTGKALQEILNAYRCYKAIHLSDFIYYELLRTEDFPHVEEVEKRAEAVLHFKPEYREYIFQEDTAAEDALVHYCSPVKAIEKYVGANTLSRTADYLKVDRARLQELLDSYPRTLKKSRV